LGKLILQHISFSIKQNLIQSYSLRPHTLDKLIL